MVDRPPAGRRVRMLWLRIATLTFSGGCMVFVISVVDAGDEGTTRMSAGVYYGALAVVLAAVVARTFVLVRRSGASTARALLIALAAIPALCAVGVLILWLLVVAS